MKRLDELVAMRAKLVRWSVEVINIMESNQPFIPAIAQAVIKEMRAEIVRIDLEVLDIHDAEYEVLKRRLLKHCVAPRPYTSPLKEDEIPF
ncbi:hypothetical protein LCGC14_1333910 [marine sediment metagenome]|uniref:Uncharacterized protein n=1 Tax=marine sediment metagenome TaxID=412755 RepID=A0A0F9MWL7_9ZZZZ